MTQDELKKELHYDPATGIFTRPLTRPGSAKTGSVSGSDDGKGYLRIMVSGIRYKSHRLAYLYMTGMWPASEIDHKDGVKNNNRWDNLRDATPRLNSENKRRARCDNKSGLLGVSRRRNKFYAEIQSAGERFVFGGFDTPEQAHVAYVNAKRKLHQGGTL